MNMYVGNYEGVVIYVCVETTAALLSVNSVLTIVMSLLLGMLNGNRKTGNRF